MGFQAIKGVAGVYNRARDRFTVNANSLWYWWNHTDIVRDQDTGQPIYGQCGHVSGEPDHMHQWNAAEVQRGARNFPYLFIGNEWNLCGYSDVKQCQMLHQAIGWARDPVNGNPNIRIIAPNESCYAPKMAEYGKPYDYGVDQVARLDTTYSTLYGKDLSDELYAVGIHHYYEDSFGGWANFTGIIRRAYLYAQSARPGIKVWLTEWGSLTSTWSAYKAMQTMRDYIIPRGYVNAYFFFFTYRWPGCPFPSNLFNSNGSLSLTGQRYRTTLPIYRG